jgi:MFS family permease
LAIALRARSDYLRRLVSVRQCIVRGLATETNGTNAAGRMIRELVRNNGNFRRLWAGDVVSLFGDWFNTIALFALAQSLTNAPLSVGLVMATKMLAWAVSSPIAGVIADRVDRRRLMIGSDLVRAAIVPAFLLVRDAEDLPLLYALIALQVMVGAVFRPARAASLPNIVAPHELLAANTLMSATWSVLLAVGAALGGLATHVLGTDAVFVIDALSYLLSAWFLWRTSFPSPQRARGTGSVLRVAWEDVSVGTATLWRDGRTGRMALAKGSWALGGAGLVFSLTQLGEAMRPEATALGVGLLFAARGLGTGIGPFVARRWLPDSERWPVWLGGFVALSGLFYGVAALVGPTLWVVVPILIAHGFSGANWVLSTVMLQERTPDEVRGRVFSAEWVILTGIDALMIVVTSVALDRGVVTLEQAMLASSGLMLVSGGAWLWWVPRAERESGRLGTNAKKAAQ